MSHETSTFYPRALLRPALGLAGLSLLVFGLGYSLLATGIAGVAFPHQARGSLVERDGVVVGSSLVAQPFAQARYFVPRPSAADYDLMALGGSNQARTEVALRDALADTRTAIAERDHVETADVPADLATRSGSGIDPHISPAAARVQVRRVAAARGLDASLVQTVVDTHTREPTFGLLGAARVNVLELNLALDALAAGRGAQ